MNFQIKQLGLIIGFCLLTACQSMTTTNPSKTHHNLPSKQMGRSQAIEQGIIDYQLDNGLRVIIKPQKSPLVMTQIWYKVGSNDEPVGKGGISHFLEHMMFKESHGIDGEIYDQVVSHFGGSRNAFTSNSVTSYYQLLPANQYPLGLEIEANRMRGLVFDKEKFNKEKEVVKEERRQRTDDNPISLAYESFAPKLFDNSKSRPIIGSMADIDGLTMSDLQDWYDKYYYANNATLVIVGGVEVNEVKKWVNQYFAHLPQKSLPTSPKLTQKSHRGYQEMTTYQEVTVPSLLIAYNVPSITTAKQKSDAYALALFSDVADGGHSSHLPKVLVRQKQILNSVSTGYSAYDVGDDVFTIWATPRDGIGLEEAKEAILSELNQLMDKPISDIDLKKGQVSLKTALIIQNDSIRSQASTLGNLAMLGLPLDTFDKLPNELAKIDSDQIRKVAKEYLVKDNMSVLYIYPKSMQTQLKKSNHK